MREIFYMTKRNCQNYLRDRGAVFTSVLSMLIVLMLMVVFLGRMNSESLVLVLEQYGGERDKALDEKNAAYLVQLWTLAGILVVNAVTVTLTVVGSLVEDETKKKAKAFYVTPVKRWKLNLGYVLAAWLVGFFMCLVTLGAGEVYFVLGGHELLPAGKLLTLCGMIGVNTFVFSALGYCMALFVHSASAWGGILTIVGTLVGFLGGIYLPMEMLSERIQAVLKCLPVLHGASMMRSVCTEEAVRETFVGLPEAVQDIFRESMGITLSPWGGGEGTISIGAQIVFLLFWAALALAAAAFINRKRTLKS